MIPAAAESEPQFAQRHAAALERPLRAPNVLVVDDDPCMRDLLRIHLSNAGYEVTTAEDAVAALKSLLRRPPKLMVVDVNMPYMDGLEFVRTVKSDPAFAAMPVIFLTTRDDVDLAAKRAGALACLKKPLLANDLIAAAQSVSTGRFVIS